MSSYTVEAYGGGFLISGREEGKEETGLGGKEEKDMGGYIRMGNNVKDVTHHALESLHYFWVGERMGEGKGQRRQGMNE